MANILNENSEYIRKNANQTQNVSTSLNFTRDVSVPLATSPNHPVRLSQIDSIKEAEFQKLKAQIQNVELEQMKTCELEFYMMYANQVTLGSSSFFGSLVLIPVMSNQRRMYCVAWTKYLESNSYKPNSPNDYSICWLSENFVDSNLQSNKRVIEDPENLTDDDLAYFDKYGGIETLLPVKVYCWHYPTNFYDWACAPNLFKTTIERNTLVTSQAQVNMGLLATIDLRVKLEMPTNHYLFKEIKALQLMPIACSGNYTTNNIYGVSYMSYKKTYNGKYIEFDEIFPSFLRTHSTTKGVYINFPFEQSEQYNTLVYDSTIMDSNILFGTDQFKIAIKGLWRADENKMEWRQYANQSMVSADPNWWDDSNFLNT